jgi:hypothetical protein
MDLQGLANPVSDSVNPNILVSVLASSGYTNSGSGLRQVPTYAAAVSGYAQVQELSSSELRQAEGMNLQGVIRKIYLRGQLNGVIRPESKGGDIVNIGSQTWLVVKTLEQWATWSSAMIVLQEPTS